MQNQIQQGSRSAGGGPVNALHVGYMHDSVIQYLYSLLTKDSTENAVDDLWRYILEMYFTRSKGFVIHMQDRIKEGKKKRFSDFTVRYIKNGPPRRICLIEDKRVQLEASGSVWRSAVNQLTTYMVNAQKSNPTPKPDLYGIVNIGHYSRFYELRADSDVLTNYSRCDGRPLHVKNNEQEIDRILYEIVSLTQSGSTPPRNDRGRSGKSTCVVQ